jgi:hypothetical protein
MIEKSRSGFVSVTMDLDPGEPKTYGSYGSGSAILVYGIMNLFYKKVPPRSSKNDLRSKYLSI